MLTIFAAIGIAVVVLAVGWVLIAAVVTAHDSRTRRQNPVPGTVRSHRRAVPFDGSDYDDETVDY